MNWILSQWRLRRSMTFAGFAVGLMCCSCAAQVGGVARPVAAPQPVIIDTDIGDDIDDALAVGLALSSPELKIVGITSAWGDTELRARMLDRLLNETGRSDIPVAVGIEKQQWAARSRRLGGRSGSHLVSIRRRWTFAGADRTAARGDYADLAGADDESGGR